MPPANSQQAARTQGSRQRASQARAQPQRVETRLPISKVRWDRKFRALMLAVFLLVGWIGVGAAHALLATHTQAAQEQALVASLQRQNHALQVKKASLSQEATIERIARSLGMVQSGERPFVITGLDGH
jgi:cell division protein FtsL